MKNYTSAVPVDRTISRIESIIAKFGAQNIIKDYAGGEISSLSFVLGYEEGGRTKIVRIRVPAKVKEAEAVLRSRLKRSPSRMTLDRIHSQGARTAWKVIQDWIEVQLTLIELHQAEPLQVFMPYICDGKKTLYELMRDSGFKMLPQGQQEDR